MQYIEHLHVHFSKFAADLGTSNQAFCEEQNGQLVYIKTIDGVNYMPRWLNHELISCLCDVRYCT